MAEYWYGWGLLLALVLLCLLGGSSRQVYRWAHTIAAMLVLLVLVAFFDVHVHPS